MKLNLKLELRILKSILKWESKPDSKYSRQLLIGWLFLIPTLALFSLYTIYRIKLGGDPDIMFFIAFGSGITFMLAFFIRVSTRSEFALKKYIDFKSVRNHIDEIET